MAMRTTGVDAGRLERRLRETVSGEVAFDAGTRALYTMDASNYRHVPLGVVLPRGDDDVVAAVAACRELGVPVTPRGGGTSIAGNAIGRGVVIDTSRHYNRVRAVDPDTRTAVVEPGVVLDDLQTAAAPHGLRFGPDPSTHSRCTLGGMIGNNSCGSHAVAWGTTAQNVEKLEILCYDGTRLEVGALGDTADALHGPDAPPGRAGELRTAVRALADANAELLRAKLFPMPRRISGYALDWLLPENGRHLARALVGTEGTCATVLSATVKLVRPPRRRVLLVLGFADDAVAADAVPAILPYGPLTVEGMDQRLVALAHDPPRLPDARAWLLVEVGGDTPGAAAEHAQAIASALPGHAHQIVTEPAAQLRIWQVREAGAGLGTRLPDGAEAWPGWEDAVVPPSKLGAYLRDFHALMRRHGRRGLTYGHYGEGCLHVRIDFDLLSAPGVAAFRRFIEDAGDLVCSYGGSPSGEHGDGQARSELLERAYGREVLDVFAAYKAVFDPDDKMNPGVLVRPRPLDADLRFAAVPPTNPSARTDPPGNGRPLGDRPPITLALAHDQGSFGQAMRRCVGVGKCRNTGGGVMCPSYMVTREEKHSTRGRAHLLFEMLSGEVVRDGWRSAEVRDALDLCLMCKGCARDCPVSVDMATYKAEFLHQHYRRRVRPASHYSMGWLPLWLRGASAVPGLPGLANRLGASTGPLVTGAKRAAGIARERTLPALAAEPLTRWFRRRTPSPGAGDGAPAPRGRVLLWPDTFTNYFTPSAGQAAVEVLEAAGFEVALPSRPVCCGLTWLSTGQLPAARRALRRTLSVLGPELDAGTPVVGLEPSCTAVFRSDLAELLPDDPRARQLANTTHTLAELLTTRAPDWSPPNPLSRSALVQVHCHQHAVLGFGADRTLMDRAGITATVPDSGCCGLAGNFGFEPGHYEVSTACAERVLAPAVRAATPETLILADGFSCRTQIQQQTPRQAMHLAEALRLAMEPPPERPVRPVTGAGGRRTGT